MECGAGDPPEPGSSVRELEADNARLRLLVSELLVENQILRERANAKTPSGLSPMIWKMP